ncbi:ribose-phosphate pyrophosphokinase [Buchnera aphidicola]|uniref:ribose-phosphate pyrophosphokinase n=1 Tax=Buchnera aphidicola TaxID=9 RepID=UPI0030ED1CE6
MSIMKIFSGNSVKKLSKKITKILKCKLGLAKINKFSDGEINIQIKENVRGGDIFIIQSICFPCNDHLMELIVMIDALRRASAGRITAIIPYFGYARQDKRVRSARIPITAKIIADFLSNTGVDRVLTIDLHSEQIQGFFDIPVDNIFGSLVLLENILKKKIKNPIIVSPDIGGVIRARAIAKLLNDSEIAIIDKRRPSYNISKVMNVIGNVNKRNCILIDDMIDTGGTICNAAKALKKMGSKKIYAYATHPVFSGNAFINIAKSCLNKVIVCDTIPLSKNMKLLPQVKVLSIAKMLSEIIRRLGNEKSISEMFKN